LIFSAAQPSRFCFTGWQHSANVIHDNQTHPPTPRRSKHQRWRMHSLT
jgi:hypothetical protein